MEWIPNNLLSYNVSVFPEVPLVFTERTSVQLTIPYNIQLMVNVSAILCGETAMTTVKNFFYMYSKLNSLAVYSVQAYIYNSYKMNFSLILMQAI